MIRALWRSVPPLTRGLTDALMFSLGAFFRKATVVRERSARRREYCAPVAAQGLGGVAGGDVALRRGKDASVVVRRQGRV